jgi:serine protease Do
MVGGMATKKQTPPPLPPEPPVKSPWRLAFFVLLILIISIASLAAGIAGTLFVTKSASTLLNRTAVDGNQTVTETESNIAAVADKVTPSVVSVVTSTQVRSFYGSGSQEGAGTGIIVSESGYVMTNYHVIEGANDVSIIDSDGVQYDNVEIIGRDPLNDIAFLKISADKDFTPAEIGDSSTVRTGQQVVAIGNALGQYKNTVTSGILSGTGRPITAANSSGETESLVDLLQTDASINAGNSGGPLLNLSGQVIGINTAVASDGNDIGFAIPINATRGLLASVLEDGRVERAYLGVNYLSIIPEVARQYDLPVTQGAYVFRQEGSAVLADGPADRAGLRQGDIIQKINDDLIGEQGGLSSILGQYRPGDEVTLTVLRGDETLELSVTLGRYEE